VFGGEIFVEMGNYEIHKSGVVIICIGRNICNRDL
jgi:hypothetical protein